MVMRMVMDLVVLYWILYKQVIGSVQVIRIDIAFYQVKILQGDNVAFQKRSKFYVSIMLLQETHSRYQRVLSIRDEQVFL